MIAYKGFFIDDIKLKANMTKHQKLDRKKKD